MTTLAMLALGNQAWGAPGTYWRAASKLRQNKLQSIMYERLQQWTEYYTKCEKKLGHTRSGSTASFSWHLCTGVCANDMDDMLKRKFNEEHGPVLFRPRVNTCLINQWETLWHVRSSRYTQTQCRESPLCSSPIFSIYKLRQLLLPLCLNLHWFGLHPILPPTYMPYGHALMWTNAQIYLNQISAKC